MTDYLIWFSEMLLGDLGRPLLQVLRDNVSIIFGLACIYGLVLAYARMIFKRYLPNKLKLFVENRSSLQAKSKEQLIESISKDWEDELKGLPWYIVVPTKNELWVKRPDKHYRLTKQLPFRKEKDTVSDPDWIDLWLKKEEV